VNLTQSANAIFNNMPDDCLGRDRAEGGTFNLDVQWQPEENLTTFAFAHYGLLTTKFAGRNWNSSGFVGLANSTNYNYLATQDQQDQTYGIGFKWIPSETTWDISGHYAFSHGRGSTSFATGSSVTGETSVPDSTSQSHAVQLYAKWNFSRAMTVRFNYLYETLKSYDWALVDPVTGQPYPTTVGSLTWTGQSAPKYENHVIGVSVALHSW
ncbi:MAG TPA: MtrB/PioB family outer membrane beta-barrel protein, partial [Rhodocyclaceae bacterium]